MRKILACLLVVSLLMGVVWVSVAEEQEPEVFTSGDWQYVVLEDGTAEIRSFSGLDAKDVFFIPEVLDGKQVTSIGDGALNYMGELTSVTIPDCVVRIGRNPFYKCKKLAEIIVSPDHSSLATIDGALFSKQDKRLVCFPNAYKSESYEIPQGIKTIGDLAFESCSSLTSVTIPDSVTSIGYGAFSNCSSLVSVVIPEGLTSIPNLMFAGCTALQSLTIPNSVASVGKMAFVGCTALRSVQIPDSVTEVGESAFSGCDNLTCIVSRDSYAAQYCKDNGIKYTYPDANDWLND